MRLLFFLLSFLFIKRRVDCVEVLAVEVILSDSQGVSKALIVHDFALAQIAQRVTHVGVVAQADEVVVGHARLLLCRQVFVEVGNYVALNTDILHIIGHARCRHGVNTRCMVNKIRCKRRIDDLFLGDVSCQLIKNCGYHFDVGEFFRALRSIGNVPQRKFDAKYESKRPFNTFNINNRTSIAIR